MQSDKTVEEKYVLMAIPSEVYFNAGLGDGECLQFTADRGKLTIEVLDLPESTLCDGDCEACSFSEDDCDGDCENCPCFERCD